MFQTKIPAHLGKVVIPRAFYLAASLTVGLLSVVSARATTITTLTRVGAEPNGYHSKAELIVGKLSPDRGGAIPS